MNYDNFYITREGYKDYLTVRVYKTQKSMLQAERKLSEIYKYEYNPEAKKAGALFFAVPVQKCKFTNSELTSEMFGTILLNDECLYYDLIAHECVHAALAHERLINRYLLDYYNEQNGEEERIAWYFQYIFASLLCALKEYGHKVKLTKSGIKTEEIKK